MNTQGTLEYRVQIFRATTDGVARWKGYVVTIPAIFAEGESREEVLENIRQQLAEAIATSEFVKVSGPYPESVVYGDGSELDLLLQKKGYRHYGIFADDPGALGLFDELERQPNQYTSGESAAESATAPPSGEENLSPQELAEIEERVKAMGYKHYGIFADDPGALEIFDEIERQRDQLTLGHLNGEKASAPVAVAAPEEESMSAEEWAELEAKLKENGWKHYGLFADDPGALELFDEIERQRDQRTIGG